MLATPHPHPSTRSRRARAARPDTRLRTALLAVWGIATIASIVVVANRLDWGGIAHDFERKIVPWRLSGGAIKFTHPLPSADRASHLYDPLSSTRIAIATLDALPTLVKPGVIAKPSGHLIRGAILRHPLETTILSAAIAPFEAMATLTPIISLSESERPARMAMRKRVESMEQSVALMRADDADPTASAMRGDAMPQRSASLSTGSIQASADTTTVGTSAPPSIGQTTSHDISPAVLVTTGKDLAGQTVSFVVGGDISLDARAPTSVRLAIAHYAALDPRLTPGSLEQWLTLDREEARSKGSVRITGIVRPAQRGARVTIDVTEISALDAPAH